MKEEFKLDDVDPGSGFYFGHKIIYINSNSKLNALQYFNQN